MALLDLDKYRRQEPAQRRLAAAEDCEFVSFDVALDEVDALECEIVQPASLDLNHLMGADRPSEAC
jgi:hypothetical protein